MILRHDWTVDETEALIARPFHDLLADAHEHRLTDLDAGVVAVRDAVVGAVGVRGTLVADDREVVHHARGDRLVVGLLGAVGRDRVLVRPRPRVVVLSTGDELVEPGTSLTPGRIPDSNSFMLAAAARESGAMAYRVGFVSDDPRVLMDTLEDQLIPADRRSEFDRLAAECVVDL